MVRTKFSFLFAGLLALSTAQAAPFKLNGAGATFPYPLYSKWFYEFRKADSGTEINYQSIGSGGGIRSLLDKTVDFGASDAPMTDELMKKSATPILHIPTVLGAVVLTFNLPGVTELKLSPEVVADLFLGKITKWSDPKILADNPGLKVDAKTPLIIAHRADGSGTSAVFTEYLSKISGEWKSKVGAGTAIKWPVGLGGKGNEGVTGLVKQTPGTIGYIELTYAVSNKLPVAELKNASGNFIKASTASITAAADASAKSMPEDFRVSITNTDGKAAYPISAFTYILAYEKMPKDKANKLKAFLKWAMKDGQKMATDLTYAPLPKTLTALVLKKIDRIQGE